MDKRIIPEVVVKQKGQLGRELVFKRYFDRYRKSPIIAFTLWFILCLFGAHRFYLGKWKHAVALILISQGIFLFVPATSGAPIKLLLLVMLVEGVWLFAGLRTSNQELQTRLKREIDNVTYVPLT